MAIEKNNSFRPTAPPKKTGPAASVRSATMGSAAAEGRHRKRKEGAQSVQQAVGLALMAARQPADAAAIGKLGDPVIDELVRLGDEDEQIGKALDYLTKTGPYSALILATLPLVMQLAVNHGRMKPNALMPGVVTKETLIAEVNADLAEVQLRAAKAQRDAEDRLQGMQDQVMAAGNGFQNATPETAPVPQPAFDHEPAWDRQ